MDHDAINERCALDLRAWLDQQASGITATSQANGQPNPQPKPQGSAARCGSLPSAEFRSPRRPRQPKRQPNGKGGH